jgi:hypothetical protein
MYEHCLIQYHDVIATTRDSDADMPRSESRVASQLSNRPFRQEDRQDCQEEGQVEGQDHQDKVEWQQDRLYPRRRRG